MAGASGDGEGAKGFGGAEVGSKAKLFSGIAQDAALQGGLEGGEGGEVEGDAFRGGTASAADGAAGEDDVGGDARDLVGPEDFFVVGEFSHLGEVLAEAGVPGFEEREQFATDAVAGKGELSVGGVFAPGLVEGIQVGFDFSAGGGEEGAEDAAFGVLDGGMDAAETFGPGAAKDFGEHGFGLIVGGVGGGDGVGETA